MALPIDRANNFPEPLASRRSDLCWAEMRCGLPWLWPLIPYFLFRHSRHSPAGLCVCFPNKLFTRGHESGLFRVGHVLAPVCRLLLAPDAQRVVLPTSSCPFSLWLAPSVTCSPCRLAEHIHTHRTERPYHGHVCCLFGCVVVCY